MVGENGGLPNFIGGGFKRWYDPDHQTMKSTFLLLGLVTASVFSSTVSTTHAEVVVGVGVGFGHPEYYHHGWATRPAYVCGPTVYVAPAVQPVYVDPAPVVYVNPPATAPASIPYGFVQNGGLLKSPYSDFTINLGGHSSGDILYDANNGKPFKVP